ncbi:MAG: hypothetical protein ACRERX_04235 [Pseudomonas sp.]
MQATLIDGVLLIAIIVAVVIFYLCAYSSGVKDGTDTGYDGGYCAGKSAGAAESGTIIRNLRNDAEQLRHLREIERRNHQAALEATIQDSGQRIDALERHSALLNHADMRVLIAAARKLSIAADLYAGMRIDDQAHSTRQIALDTLNISERLRSVLETAATPASTEAA